jgi:hypothetical protein
MSKRFCQRNESRLTLGPYQVACTSRPTPFLSALERRNKIQNGLLQKPGQSAMAKMATKKLSAICFL